VGVTVQDVRLVSNRSEKQEDANRRHDVQHGRWKVANKGMLDRKARSSPPGPASPDLLKTDLYSAPTTLSRVDYPLS